MSTPSTSDLAPRPCLRVTESRFTGASLSHQASPSPGKFSWVTKSNHCCLPSSPGSHVGPGELVRRLLCGQVGCPTPLVKYTGNLKSGAGATCVCQATEGCGLVFIRRGESSTGCLETAKFKVPPVWLAAGCCCFHSDLTHSLSSKEGPNLTGGSNVPPLK